MAPRSRYVSSFADQEPLKVVVGMEMKCYYIHRGVACANSHYFATRAKDCWSQSDQCIHLEAIAIKDFEIVLDWIYSNKLPEYFTNVTEATQFATSERICQIYKVADLLIMTSLQNALVEMLLQENNKWGIVQGFDRLLSLARNDLTHTPLYDLVLRNAVKFMMDANIAEEHIEQKVESLSEFPELLKDVCVNMKKYYSSPWLYVSVSEAEEYYVRERNGQTKRVCISDDLLPNKRRRVDEC